MQASKLFNNNQVVLIISLMCQTLNSRIILLTALKVLSTITPKEPDAISTSIFFKGTVAPNFRQHERETDRQTVYKVKGKA